MPLTIPWGNLMVPFAMTKNQMGSLPLFSCFFCHVSLHRDPSAPVRGPAPPSLWSSDNHCSSLLSWPWSKVAGSTNAPTRRLYRSAYIELLQAREFPQTLALSPLVKVTLLGKSTLVAISIKYRKAVNRFFFFFFKTEGKTAASGKARLPLATHFSSPAGLCNYW